MNNTIPNYNDPAQCIHFAENGRCHADWYHEECALCSTWIRCPKYEAKNGITYDILNDAEIVASYGGEYLLTHVIASLKSTFARSRDFIFKYYIDDENSTVTINDVADERSILEFSIESRKPGKIYIKFNGQIKC